MLSRSLVRCSPFAAISILRRAASGLIAGSRMCAMFPGRTALPAVASTQLLHIVQIRTEGARFRHRRRPARAMCLLRCPPFLLRQVWPSLPRALRPIMLLRWRWRRPLSGLQVRLRLPPKPVLTMQVVFSIFRHIFPFPGKAFARQWSVSGPAILIWVRCLVPARWA